jgi:hypothetical protein
MPTPVGIVLRLRGEGIRFSGDTGGTQPTARSGISSPLVVFSAAGFMPGRVNFSGAGTSSRPNVRVRNLLVAQPGVRVHVLGQAVRLAALPDDTDIFSSDGRAALVNALGRGRSPADWAVSVAGLSVAGRALRDRDGIALVGVGRSSRARRGSGPRAADASSLRGPETSR